MPQTALHPCTDARRWMSQDALPASPLRSISIAAPSPATWLSSTTAGKSILTLALNAQIRIFRIWVTVPSAVLCAHLLIIKHGYALVAQIQEWLFILLEYFVIFLQTLWTAWLFLLVHVWSAILDIFIIPPAEPAFRDIRLICSWNSCLPLTDSSQLQWFRSVWIITITSIT